MPGLGGSGSLGQALSCLISPDPISDSTPTFSLDVSSRLRALSVRRGRSSEYDDFSPGQMTVVLDNRDGALTPPGNLVPRMRIKLSETTSGVTEPIYYGFIDGIRQGWDPSGNVDQTVTVVASDALKLLGIVRLPAMDPPSCASYSDLISFDQPTNYYSMNGDPEQTFRDWLGWSSTLSLIRNETPIIGDQIGNSEDGAGGSLRLSATGALTSTTLATGDPRGTTTGFTVEFWIRKTGNPIGTTDMMQGPTIAGGGRSWLVQIDNAGHVGFKVWDAIGAAFVTQFTTTALSNNVWHHIALVYDGKLRLYLDGAQDALSAAVTGLANAIEGGANMKLLGVAAVTSLDLAQLAIYSYPSPNAALPAARVTAHYNAGNTGGIASESSFSRLSDVLAQITAPVFTPQSGGSSAKTMRAIALHGQTPLEELRRCQQAELADGALFVDANGAVNLLAANHRGGTPWNTTQVIFGEHGLPERSYLPPLEPELNDSRIINDWTVTRDGRGGLAQVSTDSTSISKYGDLNATVSGLSLLVNADAATIAGLLLTKTKDPATSLPTIQPNMSDAEVAKSVFGLELLDRIEVRRIRMPDKGTIVVLAYVQSIEHNWTADVPIFQTTLGISTL